jgi:hypothetical protein
MIQIRGYSSQHNHYSLRCEMQNANAGSNAFRNMLCAGKTCEIYEKKRKREVMLDATHDDLTAV